MPNVPIPVVGTTYQSRSLPVSAQVTQNFYIEVDQNSENIASFQSFPGLKSFATTGAGLDRGIGTYNGTLYKVTGNTLYSISLLGVSTAIGTIPGTNRCQLVDDGQCLVITTGGDTKPYSYDGTTLTLGTDVDLPEASSVAYIKRRVVYDGAGADVCFADLDTPLSVNSANVTIADSKPDNILAVHAWKDQLFAFGESSIAPYYNSGTGNPPYDVIQNAVQEIGLKAVHSIASNNNAIYFLGNDLVPYRLIGLTPQAIGNPAIGQAIASYPTPEDAIGACFTFHGQNFYYLSFPNGGSWLFSEGAGWTSLAYGVDNEPHLMNGYAYCYNKHLVSDRRNGNVYELDFDTFTDNGDTIQRRRDTAKISGKELGFPGKEIYMHSLELVLETGVGLANGQGVDPQIIMQFSDDGGRTWSREQWRSMGEMGDFTIKVMWHDLGAFYERMFRFTISDPVKVALISANSDISIGV